jgi:predicted PhzF superfamily epimerase YddE/YHI9
VLDFPATREVPAAAPEDLIEALGVPASYVGKNQFDYLVEVGSEASVRGLKPDLARLRKVEARGVIVTARAQTHGFDFVSRFFAPQVGIDEDPVTGSAHCCLAPYWAERLGKTEMTGYQASARGGVVRVELRGDRVSLIGQAISVLRAELLV